MLSVAWDRPTRRPRGAHRAALELLAAEAASALDRADLLDMRGNPDSGGIWAPCLSYADGLFWLVYTDVKRKSGNELPIELAPVPRADNRPVLGNHVQVRTSTIHGYQAIARQRYHVCVMLKSCHNLGFRICFDNG